MEAAIAIAPGAHIEVCLLFELHQHVRSGHAQRIRRPFHRHHQPGQWGERPDIISVTYPGYWYSEDQVDSASKTALDLLTAQADAEGISVFTGTGDSGTNSDFTGGDINAAGPTVASLASSPYVTAVGGTDLADELDGTTSQYFSSTPNADYGTALGYVPEIPWNKSCGNGVVAKADGFSSAVASASSCWRRIPMPVT